LNPKIKSNSIGRIFIFNLIIIKMKKMIAKINEFIDDDRGIGEDVFRLALIVIIVAVVLVVLALVWQSAQKGATGTAEKAEEAGDKIANITLPGGGTDSANSTLPGGNSS